MARAGPGGVVWLRCNASRQTATGGNDDERDNTPLPTRDALYGYQPWNGYTLMALEASKLLALATASP